jgi:predicted RNA-binding Zn ribbon-like protein
VTKRHPPAIFIADAPGLDFLNSIATPVDEVVEWIEDGDGLLDWLAQAKLVPPDVLEAVRARAMPGELDRVADQARELREWFRTFVRRHMGRPLTAKALRELEPLNGLLARDDAFGQLVQHRDASGSHLELTTMRRWRSPEQLLVPIGEVLARFVCDESFADVRVCEGGTCTLLFLDRTRRRARRWCSMAVCGNRAKQAAHRHRLKQK